MTYLEIAQELEAKIFKDYGFQCPNFQISCECCQMWMALKIILDAAAIERNQGWNEIYKNRKNHRNLISDQYGK